MVIKDIKNKLMNKNIKLNLLKHVQSFLISIYKPLINKFNKYKEKLIIIEEKLIIYLNHKIYKEKIKKNYKKWIIMNY